MKRVMATAVLALLLSVAAMAAPPNTRRQPDAADFWRIREHVPVVLVLDTGGECRGKVERRAEGVLTVQLESSSPDCGVRGHSVTVRRENTKVVERDEPRGASARRKTVAVAVAAGAGLLLTHVPPRAMIAVGAAGLQGMGIINRDLDRAPRSGYVLYVTKLE